MVNPSIDDAPLLASGTERRSADDGAAPGGSVELTPRGLELLETLNDLFDTLAGASHEPLARSRLGESGHSAAERGSEPAHGTHEV